MDNGTMVQAFKFLNYYQLATNSFVSKRFWNLIRTHRHKLALLYVHDIYMDRYVANEDPAVIKMFDEVFSPEEYNKLIARNGYSKQVPLEGRIAGKESSENDHDFYEFWAHVYPDRKHWYGIPTTVLYARTELKDETWPLFQHFIRLIMDPFIYIRSLSLYSLTSVFTLLAGAINPDRARDRLQCEKLTIDFNGDTKKIIVWIKDHAHCDEFQIYFDRDLNNDYDEELSDFFLTGAPSTSEINLIEYDLSKVIIDLMQKYTGLKSLDEYQMVESIRGHVYREAVEELKRTCAEFISEEEKCDEVYSTTQVIGFINKNIEKKLTLYVRNFFCGPSTLSIKITNL